MNENWIRASCAPSQDLENISLPSRVSLVMWMCLDGRYDNKTIHIFIVAFLCAMMENWCHSLHNHTVHVLHSLLFCTYENCAMFGCWKRWEDECMHGWEWTVEWIHLISPVLLLAMSYFYSCRSALQLSHHFTLTEAVLSYISNKFVNSIFSTTCFVFSRTIFDVRIVRIDTNNMKIHCKLSVAGNIFCYMYPQSILHWRHINI
jgi:hypothetical protein